MAEIASPFALTPQLAGLRIDEVRGRTILQVTGFDSAAEQRLAACLGAPLPKKSLFARGGIELVWLAPARWLAASTLDGFEVRLRGALAPACAVLDVTHAYSILRLEWIRLRDILAEVCPLDLDSRQFPPGSAARSTFLDYSTAIYIARSESVFEVYLPRTLARSGRHDLETLARRFEAARAATLAVGS
jgi:heterotetrameric sarcosine oxidase gamma subunit